MATPDRTVAAAPGSLSARVAAVLTAAHFLPIEPEILQPASVFLDLSGEDIRGRLYLSLIHI